MCTECDSVGQIDLVRYQYCSHARSQSSSGQKAASLNMFDLDASLTLKHIASTAALSSVQLNVVLDMIAWNLTDVCM